MKSRLIGVAFVLGSGLLCLGASNPKVGMVGRSVPVTPQDSTRAVRDLKAGVMQEEEVLHGNAYRSETPENTRASNQPAALHHSDTVFRK